MLKNNDQKVAKAYCVHETLKIDRYNETSDDNGDT